MKKLALILLILFGISYFGHAQASFKAKAEHFITKKDKEIKPHRQMSHFAKAPRDRKLRYNGTQVRRNQTMNSKYNVEGNGFKSNKKFDDNQVNDKVRKVRNKSTGTYTMK
jgi:hypothetical protein